MKCDVCGYEHKTAVSLSNDGIIRCNHCRHRAKYGRVLNTVQDYAEYEGEPLSEFDPAPIQPNEGKEGAAAFEMTVKSELSAYQAKQVAHE